VKESAILSHAKAYCDLSFNSDLLEGAIKFWTLLKQITTFFETSEEDCPVNFGS